MVDNGLGRNWRSPSCDSLDNDHYPTQAATRRVHDIYGASGPLTAQIFDKDEKFISAIFSTEESEKVSNISRGETITGLASAWGLANGIVVGCHACRLPFHE
jgi:hypothetical protein